MENKEIKTKKEFTQFICKLSEDYYNHSDTWENKDLGTFLTALAAWVEDMDGYYLNQGHLAPENPEWQMIANMLTAAKTYE